MNLQPDQQFSGFVSGHQTTILLNSRRLHFKIETPTHQSLYQSTIQYSTKDVVFLQVKRVFKNLNLLFEYINEYSQDVERIGIDFKELRIRVVKNQGPRRLKNAPVLFIPLRKVFVFEKKQPTKIQKDIETAVKFSQILHFRCEYEKNQRKRIMDEYNQLKHDISNMIKASGIQQISHLLLLLDQDQQLEQDQQKQHYNCRSTEEKLVIEQHLERILMKNDQKQQENEESLFFQDQSISGIRYRSEERLENIMKNEESKPNEWIISSDQQHQAFTQDVFSYL